jgi:putative CocE/NonD family hydrolase
MELMATANDNFRELGSLLPLEKIEGEAAFRLFGLAPYFHAWLAHPRYDRYWKEIDAERYYDQMNVAGMHIGGWYDIFLKGTIQNHLGLSRESRRAQKLIIGPWVHGQDLGYGVGEWDAGIRSQGSSIGIEEMQLKWFDYWLKGNENGVLEEPPIMIYILGENRWRTEEEWPLARTVYTKYYLHTGGGANTLKW